MTQTAAGQEARPRWSVSRTVSRLKSRVTLWIKSPMFWLIFSFTVMVVGLGLYRLARGEGESFAQDFFALCLDGIVFAGFVAYLEGRQALAGRVRLKSHAISLLLAGLPDDEQKRHSQALSDGRRSSGVYALSQNALGPVLDAVCKSLGVQAGQATGGTALHSGLDIQVLSGMLPVAAELSGRHLRAWGQIVESVKAYRGASSGSPDSQRAIVGLRGALEAFLTEEVFAP